jgi:hypothetical protein
MEVGGCEKRGRKGTRARHRHGTGILKNGFGPPEVAAVMIRVETEDEG